MSKIIDADRLKEEHNSLDWQDTYLRAAIDNAPAVDAVEVVRCKDCVKRDICRTTNTWAIPPDDDWYCADGERKGVIE